ncbi:hypothetical protein ABID59_007358 [Bradyrhizobium sp. S3.3.6]
MGAARNVGKGLVNGNAFQKLREIADHLDGRVIQPLVFPKMPADKVDLRAKLARLSSRHAPAHSEGPGFVRCGKHNPTADGDWLAAQRRVKQLLYRGIEGVQVRIQDGAVVAIPIECPWRFEDVVPPRTSREIFVTSVKLQSGIEATRTTRRISQGVGIGFNRSSKRD